MAAAALATAPQRLYVALGAEIVGCTAALAGLAVTILHCSDWSLGMGATLAQAVRAIGPADAGLLVLGVDQPYLDAAHLQCLVDRWQQAPARAVASGYGDTLGTPVIFPAHWGVRLSALSGDQGARALLRAETAEVAVLHAPQLALDLDDAQDFATLTAGKLAPGGGR